MREDHLFLNVTLWEHVKQEKLRSISMFSDGPVHLDRIGALIGLGDLI